MLDENSEMKSAGVNLRFPAACSRHVYAEFCKNKKNRWKICRQDEEIRRVSVKSRTDFHLSNRLDREQVPVGHVFCAPGCNGEVRLG